MTDIPNNPFRRRLHRPLLPAMLCLGLALAGLTGCGLIGGLYGVFIDPLIPPPTIEAEHQMQDARLLVWVDDAWVERPDPFLRRYLTQAIAEDLRRHDAVAELVEYTDIARFRQQNPDLTDYTVAQLGQEFNADQVLYLLIERFQLHHDAGQGFYRPEISGYAQVIDVRQAKRLWPAQQNKQPFHYEANLAEGKDPAYERKLLEQLARDIAQDLAPRFYRHQLPKNP